MQVAVRGDRPGDERKKMNRSPRDFLVIFFFFLYLVEKGGCTVLHINISSLIEKKRLELPNWSDPIGRSMLAAKPFSIHTCAVSHGQLGYLVLISPVVFSLVSSPL